MDAEGVRMLVSALDVVVLVAIGAVLALRDRAMRRRIEAIEQTVGTMMVVLDKLRDRGR